MQFDPKKANEPLLAEIAACCARHRLSPTAFGEKSLNDKALIPDLRNGRQLLPSTLFRVRAFIAECDGARVSA